MNKKLLLLFFVLLFMVFGCDVQDSATLPDPSEYEDDIAEQPDNTPEPKQDKDITDNDTSSPDLSNDNDEETSDSTEEDPDIDDVEEDKIIDETCGLHKGDESVFSKVPALEPMNAEETLGDSPEPRFVHLSWQSNPAISMSFTWQTKDSGSGNMTKSTIVKVCKNEDMNDSCTEINSTNNGKMIGSATILPYSSDYKTMHVAEICGLEPSTKYYYQVGGRDGSGNEAFSKVYHFRTGIDPRLPSEQSSYKFVAMGDSRGAPDKLAQTIKAALDEDPDFIIHSGDFCSDGRTQSDWENLFTASEELLPYVPIMGIHGNHEYSGVNYYAQMAFPGNEQWYSMEYGNAEFVMLNDISGGIFAIGQNSDLVKNNSISNEQKAFISDTFAAHTDKTWRFVAHHRPIKSETSDLTHGGKMNTDLRDAWGPVFEQYKVNMVFNGHDHFYQRSKPLINVKSGGTVTSADKGVNYIVTAGAGASLYDTKETDLVAKTAKAIHFCLIEINGSSIDLTVKQLSDGTVSGIIDTLSFSK